MRGVIADTESVEYTIDVPPLVHVKLVAIPPKLPSHHPLRQQFDDRSIDIPKTKGSIWVNVCTEDGTCIAQAVFAADETVICDTIDVNADHRRMGLATMLYDLAEQFFCAPIEPSNDQSDTARLFWANRRKKN